MVPFFARAVRARMQLRMMMDGPKMATAGHCTNREMMQYATEFIEPQIKDPELRGLMRPETECLYQSFPVPFSSILILIS